MGILFQNSFSVCGTMNAAMQSQSHRDLKKT